MVKIFCDSCGKKLPYNYHASIYGYDACPDKRCHAKLIIKASTENYAYPFSALIPNEKDVEEAREMLSFRRNKKRIRTGTVARKRRRLERA